MIRILLRYSRAFYLRFITLLYKYRFKFFGKKSYLHSPLKIDGIENIEIGSGVSIAYKTWLAAMPLTGEKSKLVIEDGVHIGNFNHIYATQSIIIRKDVLTADKVYISDNLHGYEDIYIPIIKQPIVQKKEVEIGEGSWLGENVCIIGASIGKNCVVGANSVVTKDFPDYCVIVGAPAKIVKRYCFEQQKWKKYLLQEVLAL